MGCKLLILRRATKGRLSAPVKLSPAFEEHTPDNPENDTAVRKMVTEAKRNGFLSAEEAASLTDVPNIPAAGNTSWKLAHERAGKGTARCSRSRYGEG